MVRAIHGAGKVVAAAWLSERAGGGGELVRGGGVLQVGRRTASDGGGVGSVRRDAAETASAVRGGIGRLVHGVPDLFLRPARARPVTAP